MEKTHSIRDYIKLTLLYLSKALGLFALARQLTAGELRILCYHGFAIDDTHEFRPSLFMRANTFERRLKYLSENGFSVIDLQSAHEALQKRQVQPLSVVITIDDGFYSVYLLAFPLLKKYKFPSTLYVTSYYVEHPNPIFRIALQYLFWKTQCETADFSNLVPNMATRCDIKGEAGSLVLWQIIEYAEQQMAEEDRNALLDRIAEILMIDFGWFRDRRSFHLATPNELKEMQVHGVNIQLHTHRHRMPDDEDKLRAEIERNRAVLSLFTRDPLIHFCYPSGVWSETHWPMLEKVGVETATTCAPRFNNPGTNPLALNRFLDRDDFADIVFEAEVSGFKEIVRRLLTYFRRPNGRRKIG